jgi:hypothetical protein
LLYAGETIDVWIRDMTVELRWKKTSLQSLIGSHNSLTGEISLSTRNLNILNKLFPDRAQKLHECCTSRMKYRGIVTKKKKILHTIDENKKTALKTTPSKKKA